MNLSPTGAEVLFLWPEELQSLLRRILDAHSAGLLSDRWMTRIVQGLVVGDGAGRLWTVGLRSGGFYRWEGSGWVEDEPRGRLLLPTAGGPVPTIAEAVVPATRQCPACGAIVRSGARFCTSCGADAPGE